MFASPHLDDACPMWRKSSYSSAEGADCVELASADGRLLVRDSKHPEGDRLRFGREQARSLILAVKHL